MTYGLWPRSRHGPCVRTDALDHCGEPVRTLWRHVLLEAELGEDCLRVGAQDVIRRLAGVDGEQDGDQAAHDMGVAVALEAEARGPPGAASIEGGPEPDLTGAAADLVSVRAVGLGQGR